MLAKPTSPITACPLPVTNQQAYRGPSICTRSPCKPMQRHRSKQRPVGMTRNQVRALTVRALKYVCSRHVLLNSECKSIWVTPGLTVSQRAQRAQTHPQNCCNELVVTVFCLFNSTGSTWWPASLSYLLLAACAKREGQDGAEPATPGSQGPGILEPGIPQSQTPLQSRPEQRKAFRCPGLEAMLLQSIASKAKCSSSYRATTCAHSL